MVSGSGSVWVVVMREEARSQLGSPSYKGFRGLGFRAYTPGMRCASWRRVLTAGVVLNPKP